MRHPLHESIGKLIDTIELPSDCEVIKDPACGGRQNVPLFCSNKKSNKTEYCNVDILILKNEKIRVIVEIEETDIKPTQICGKFLTSALSSYFIHKTNKTKKKSIRMDDSVLFIQILDTSKLKMGKTSKIEQWKRIEKSIQNIIPVKNSKIDNYKLIFGKHSKFEANGKKKNELIGCIQEVIK